MHIHVEGHAGEAKFWLEPTIELAQNWGLSEIRVKSAFRLVQEHEDEIRFWPHWFGCYRWTVAIGVRRLVKPRRDSISLVGLLQEIQRNPNVLSREHYRSLILKSSAWPNEIDEMVRTHLIEVANKEYDGLADVGADCLSPDTIGQEIRDLEAAAESIVVTANKQVAHIDLRRPSTSYTFDDLDRTIRHLRNLYTRYLCLIKGAQEMDILENLSPDWKDVFTVPWAAT